MRKRSSRIWKTCGIAVGRHKKGKNEVDKKTGIEGVNFWLVHRMVILIHKIKLDKALKREDQCWKAGAKIKKRDEVRTKAPVWKRKKDKTADENARFHRGRKG